MTTIGLNIVFGIIVDTFSELRDEKVKQKPEFLVAISRLAKSKDTCFPA